MALTQLGGSELAERVDEAVPGAVDQWSEETLWIRPSSIADVAGFLLGGWRIGTGVFELHIRD